jgi:hypothetical protein
MAVSDPAFVAAREGSTGNRPDLADPSTGWIRPEIWIGKETGPIQAPKCRRLYRQIPLNQAVPGVVGVGYRDAALARNKASMGGT